MAINPNTSIDLEVVGCVPKKILKYPRLAIWRWSWKILKYSKPRFGLGLLSKYIFKYPNNLSTQ